MCCVLWAVHLFFSLFFFVSVNLSRGNTGEDGWGCVYTLCPEIDSCKKDGVEPLPYDGSRVWVGDRYLFGREGLVFGKMKKMNMLATEIFSGGQEDTFLWG